MIEISGGWKWFIRTMQFPSLQVAAEEMYRLNVFARHAGRNILTDEIYTLKDLLIKYLYLRGYCVEVKLHLQKRMCFSCNGTGEYWTGQDCHKCSGTGVFSVTHLYAFRFEINGMRYAWHQLKKLVDYEITLTDSQPGEYKEPARSDAILSLEQAWAGCVVVWWTLFWRGAFVGALFTSIKQRIACKLKTLLRRRNEDSYPF